MIWDGMGQNSIVEDVTGEVRMGWYGMVRDRVGKERMW